MSYDKGDVQIGANCPTRTPDGDCDCDDADHKIELGGKVYLPHSCDEWIIGGKTEVEQLIMDLQELQKTL